MFIYDNNGKSGFNIKLLNNNSTYSKDQLQRHKSVKILNLCYLKYEKNEEEELINEIENNSNMNILNVNSIKSPTQKLSTSFDIKKIIIQKMEIPYFVLN
jgi:hypothetical protein